MHDLDRTTLESNFESNFEYHTVDSRPHEAEMLGEDELSELAGELLGTSSEYELDHFLGGLFDKVVNFVGKALPGGVKQQLGGVLKSVAGKALPWLGGALGNFIAPGVGGAIGSQLGSKAGAALGLELEGLSSEEQEFHVARRFVQLAADAIRHASQTSGGNPRAVARQALQLAARVYAPGLLPIGTRPAAPPPAFAIPTAPATPPATSATPATSAMPATSHGEFLGEADEMELAAELMEATSEYEVDRFLGGILGAAGQLLGKVMPGPVGNAIGGYLKQLAGRALPQVARAIGAMPGAHQGESYASDTEYESARSFVRVAADAARRALATEGGDPLAVARQAIAGAARSHAPELVGHLFGQGTSPDAGDTASEGRWVRQGNRIVLFGV